MLNKHYQIILKRTENSILNILKQQVTEKDTIDNGGIKDVDTELVIPSTSSDPLLKLITVYLNKDSMYYKSDEIYHSILSLLDYMDRVQHSDGTFDLTTTNFYSAPDSGFYLQKVASAYKIVEKYFDDEQGSILLKRLKQLICKTGYGIMNGGFHTPNHRWVITSSLLLASNICGISEFKEMAKHYLAEGIDCDEFGEYTEKSKGIYDVINNTALIIIAVELEDDTYLEHVKRNLNMLNYFLEPDGSIFTENSVRQDKGDTFYPINYYAVFLYMAQKFSDPAYYGMLNFIMEIATSKALDVPDCLDLFMFIPEMKASKVEELVNPPNTYEQLYEKSGILRSRKDKYSFSLIRNNSNFLSFKVNNLTCNLKMCASFFGKGQFKPSVLEERNGTYYLMQEYEGNYKMPFKEVVSSSNWNEMEHEKREVVNNVTLAFQVRVKEISNGVSIDIQSEGCTRVPFKLEMVVTPNTTIEGNSFKCHCSLGHDMNIKSGYVNIMDKSDGISIGPAFYNHSFTSNMRGSEPKNTNKYTLYFTDYTELSRTIQITTL